MATRISEREAWAVMATVPGLGPATFARLVNAHGGALGVLEIARSAAGLRLLGGVSSDARSTVGSPARLRSAVVEGLGAVARDPGAVIGRLRHDGVSVVTVEEDAYPARLRTVEEPPPVLFVRGTVEALSAPHAVAIVGTRRPTEAGRRVAARTADAIARVGAVVVSGLAVGIDGSAHAASVAAGRPTVAVLGSGHGRLFPRAHARLAESIVAAAGAIVSELPPDAEATRGTFPRRNRVISGLAEATVVIEAGMGSGALITARWALEQGRGCFVVAGSIDAPASAGCNAFLREYPGIARIVAGIPELIDDLEIAEGPFAPSPTSRRAGRRATGVTGTAGSGVGAVSMTALAATLGPTAGQVARALIRGAATVDDLAARTDLPTATVLSALTILELGGLVTGAYGRYRAGGALAAVDPGLP